MTLIDLARDENFKGTVIFSLNEFWWNKRRQRGQWPYVDYYQRRSTPNSRFSAALSNIVRDSFIFLSPELNLEKLFRHFISHWGLPVPGYVSTTFDRHHSLDFDKSNVFRLKRKRFENFKKKIHTIPDAETWLEGVLRVEPAIRRIQLRGGNVVVLRLPTSQEVSRITEKYVPREKYWDEFAKRTSATTINFEDYESLSDFDCPDHSHINIKDTPLFTEALVKILKEKGVV